jgi:hypothetical protein
MAFSESSIVRNTIGRFAEKLGSRPEISLEEYDALPEPDIEPRTAPLHTSEKNRDLFNRRETLAYELRVAYWNDGNVAQGLDYLQSYREPLARFDEDHPEIAHLGTRVVKPTPELRPAEGRDADGKKTWSVDGPDGMTLVARKPGLFGGYTVGYGEGAKTWSWKGKTPEDALAAAYSGVQTDEVRESRIENLGYSASEMGSSLDTMADLRYKMGQITATERDKKPNRW